MLNIACVGAGYWGKNLIRNFNSIDALSCICDGNTETLKKFKELYPEVKVTSDFNEVLNDDKIDAVSIATPAPSHGKLILQALQAGKHVYVEKPLCLEVEEAEECIEYANKQGLTLMVGHLLWYHPMVLEIKRMVSEGEIGDLRYIYSNRLNMGLLRNEENVLWSFAPHDISMILGLTGEEPAQVLAHGANHLLPTNADQSVALMSFSKGVKAHIFVSWLNPTKEQKLVVVGEKGMIEFNDHNQNWDEKLALYKHTVEWDGETPVAKKADAEYLVIPKEEPLKNECLHFVESITNNTQPRTNGEEGLRVLKTLKKVQQAMDS